MLVEQRKSLKGEIVVPGDKSISQRAVVFGSLARGTSEIDGFLMGEECLATIECFRKMQVGIDILPNCKVKINGKGIYGLKQPAAALNAGISGTALRLILGVLAGQQWNSVLTRDESALRKPVGKVVKALRNMGAVINGREDGSFCPLNISRGRLTGMSHELPATDSHIKSAILVAGMYASGGTAVVEAVKSRNHTELMMKDFGADVTTGDMTVRLGNIQNLEARHVVVPGDFSKAAYFITAALLVPDSEIVIKNAGVNPTRTGILELYKKMGAKIKVQNIRHIGGEPAADIRVVSAGLSGIRIDESVIPTVIDEIPCIIVAATQAKGTTVIKGLSGFKVKESSHILHLCAELSKMGAVFHENGEELVIEGGKTLKGTVIESYNDFSVAAAMSVAGLIATDETMIRKTQVLDAAFPEFYDLLNKL